MTENNNQHAYLAWTKQRLDEMDAALASFEIKASLVKADAKAKAAQLQADMKQRRADFESEVKAQVTASEATLQASKAQLEKQWVSFETELKAYMETAGKDIDHKRETFANIAAAQTKTWAEDIEKLKGNATKLGTEGKAKADKAIAQMQSTATEARTHIDKFKQAGDESWTALSLALQTTRKKFDDASHSAWAAIKNVVPAPKQ